MSEHDIQFTEDEMRKQLLRGMDEVEKYFMPIIKKKTTAIRTLVDNFVITNSSVIKEHTETFADLYEKLRGKVDGS
jgi:uncharacterized protein (DUF2461 family)